MTEAAPTTTWKLPAQWRLIAAIAGGVSILLAAWYFFALRQDYTLLYRDLRPTDASAIVSELERRGVRYQLRDGGAQILVPTAQADAARLDVAASSISPTGIEGLELFDNSEMGLTDFAQKIKYQRAIQGELARTIMMMDGIVAARVHISVPERSLFRSEGSGAKAAVTLITRASSDETPARIAGIQRLVAASVSDLSVSDVVVLNGRGEILSSPVELLTAHPGPQVSAPQALLGGRGGVETNAIELVVAVVGRALPHQRFEIAIEQSPTAPQTGGNETTAGARVINITTAGALSNEDMELVRDALSRSTLIDAAADTVSFHVGLAPISALQSPSTGIQRAGAEPARRASAERDAARLDFPLWIAAGVSILLGAFIVIVLLMRRRAARTALTVEQQKQFANRLREGLKTQRERGGAVELV